MERRKGISCTGSREKDSGDEIKFFTKGDIWDLVGGERGLVFFCRVYTALVRE